MPKPLITVAVDAMGGDLAPGAVVAGALQAARHRELAVALTGPAAILREQIDLQGGAFDALVTVVDAPDTVGMDESPLSAHRRKPGSSVRVAAGLVARGEAHGLYSAGHTGATFLSARAAFGVLPGVDRPALAVTVPTRAGAAILLDAGANLDCRPEHLCQFGVMGAAYARLSLGIEHPKVGLLSIGEEAGKGTDLIREAHALLERAPLDSPVVALLQRVVTDGPVARRGQRLADVAADIASAARDQDCRGHREGSAVVPCKLPSCAKAPEGILLRAQMADPSCEARQREAGWCRVRDLNPRPSVYKTAALPLC